MKSQFAFTRNTRKEGPRNNGSVQGQCTLTLDDSGSGKTIVPTAAAGPARKNNDGDETCRSFLTPRPGALLTSQIASESEATEDTTLPCIGSQWHRTTSCTAGPGRMKPLTVGSFPARGAGACATRARGRARVAF